MQQRVFGGRWVGASLAAQHHLARYKGEGGHWEGGGHGGANCEVWRDCAPRALWGLWLPVSLLSCDTNSCDTGGHRDTTQGAKNSQKKFTPRPRKKRTNLDCML